MQKGKGSGKGVKFRLPTCGIWVSKPQICSSVFRFLSLTRQTYSFEGTSDANHWEDRDCTRALSLAVGYERQMSCAGDTSMEAFARAVAARRGYSSGQRDFKSLRLERNPF